MKRGSRGTAGAENTLGAFFLSPGEFPFPTSKPRPGQHATGSKTSRPGSGAQPAVYLIGADPHQNKKDLAAIG